MRAAEILAEMLLNEAQMFGLLYGPNIPKTGYWVQGSNLRELAQKTALGLAAQPQQQVSSFIDTLISSGYALVTYLDMPQAGQRQPVRTVVVYGLEIPDLTEKAQDIIGLTANTPVYQYDKYEGFPPTAKPTAGTLTNGREAFGVAMTPDEKAQLAAKKSQGKLRKGGWHDLTPEEEQEFNRWAMKSGKMPYGLASTLGQSQTIPAQPQAQAPAAAASASVPAPAPTPVPAAPAKPLNRRQRRALQFGRNP